MNNRDGAQASISLPLMCSPLYSRESIAPQITWSAFAHRNASFCCQCAQSGSHRARDSAQKRSSCLRAGSKPVCSGSAQQLDSSYTISYLQGEPLAWARARLEITLTELSGASHLKRGRRRCIWVLHSLHGDERACTVRAAKGGEGESGLGTSCSFFRCPDRGGPHRERRFSDSFTTR